MHTNDVYIQFILPLKCSRNHLDLFLVPFVPKMCVVVFALSLQRKLHARRTLSMFFVSILAFCFHVSHWLSSSTASSA